MLEQTQYSMLNVYLVFKNKVHKVQVSEKYVHCSDYEIANGVLLFEN